MQAGGAKILHWSRTDNNGATKANQKPGMVVQSDNQEQELQQDFTKSL